MNRTYWPFPVNSPETQSDEDRREIKFFEAAFEAGFRPYYHDCGWGASSSFRSGEIWWRGRTKWEIHFTENSHEAIRTYVGDFAAATESLLSWLSGGDVLEIADSLRLHEIVMPGVSHISKLPVAPPQPA
jgi:hypothetical protein